MLSEALSDLRYRLRAVFSRASVEQELDDELSFHIEHEAEKYEQHGMSHEAALRRARLEFGGVEQTKEASRDTRGTARIESVVRDLRYAMRSLRSRPAFTLTVIATLALGLGANTAIFTLVDALLLRPLPVSHPEQLVIVSDPGAVDLNWHGPPVTYEGSFPLYRDVRARNTVFTDMYANGQTGDLDVNIGAGNDATVEHPHARFVTGNFFAVLGVSAYAGRTFTAQEDQTPAEDPVAVITYDYWQRHFSGSRAAIGTVMRVNDVAVTIVGVTPPGFGGDIVGEPVDFWLPMMMEPAIRPRQKMIDDRQWSWVVMMGRLKLGVTLEQARQEVSAIEANAIRAQLSGLELSRFEDDLKATPIQVVSGARGFSERRAEYGKALWVLLAAVGLVILVVCANVSSLMLARTVARNREMTVRMALGAGRGRLIEQMLVEGTLLAIVSGVLGLFAATWGTRVLLATVSASSPIAIDPTPDARVLAFTATMTLACVLLFGLLPAFRATRVDVAASLRAHGRNLMGAARVGRIPFGRALVVAQIALSMLLLIGGALLVRSMQQLLHGDLGADRDHVVAVRVRTARSPYVGARLAQLRRDFVDRVGRLPGVDAVAFADHGLFGGGSSSRDIDVSGFIPQADSEREVALDRVGPNFFRAIGARLIRGRDIEPRDLETMPPATVINETMAKRYFGARDPLGGTVTVDSVPHTIVGVVRDFHGSDVRDKPRREMYVVFNDPTTGETGQAKLFVHVRGDPSRFVGPIRRAIEDVERTLPISVDPVNDLVRDTVAKDVLLVQVTIFFCLVTLVLAALGLYGVTAYSTSQRSSEFGLRAALGAEPGDVTRMVLGEAVRVAITGVVIGVPAGLAATRLIRAQLFGVGTIDLRSLSIAIVVLMATAVVASYLPARRAAKVGPLEALRLE
ncbi:MAG TPA: ABC transporter permease [Gemmatimonadaceae bacterium]|nr:ABC transporter permease [Gemmatimonadaceae bacterium]